MPGSSAKHSSCNGSSTRHTMGVEHVRSPSRDRLHARSPSIVMRRSSRSEVSRFRVRPPPCNGLDHQIGKNAYSASGADDDIGAVNSACAVSNILHNGRNAWDDAQPPLHLVCVRPTADPAEVDFASFEHPFAFIPGHIIDPLHGDPKLSLEQGALALHIASVLGAMQLATRRARDSFVASNSFGPTLSAAAIAAQPYQVRRDAG